MAVASVCDLIYFWNVCSITRNMVIIAGLVSGLESGEIITPLPMCILFSPKCFPNTCFRPGKR